MRHGNEISLNRCPHCSVANPRLTSLWQDRTQDYSQTTTRYWAVYCCATCGGVVLAVSPNDERFDVTHIWPNPQTVAEAIPERAREYLSQAIASLHAPAGAVMLTASAVDAMLKAKNLKEGSLYKRIDAAAKEHLITDEMAAWAHEIRLDANDQRHADENAGLPVAEDVAKTIEFAKALAQFLFVLPARVERGRKNEIRDPVTTE